MDGAIELAYERMKHVTQDKELLREYQMREMAMMDLRSATSYAAEEGLKKGIRKGREEGRQEGKNEIAKNMLSRGLAIDFIHEMTGLDTKTIQSL
jgi:predicted transposase/invertase (TIGR01784 family)